MVAQEELPHHAAMSEVAIHISNHTVHKNDRGLVVVGASSHLGDLASHTGLGGVSSSLALSLWFWVSCRTAICSTDVLPFNKGPCTTWTLHRCCRLCAEHIMMPSYDPKLAASPYLDPLHMAGEGLA